MRESYGREKRSRAQKLKAKQYMAASEFLQRQLYFMLHASKCMREGNTDCTRPYCNPMRTVYAHIQACTQGPNCLMANCGNYRKLAQHWNTCRNQNCRVCVPVKTLIAPRKTDVSTQVNELDLPKSSA